MKRFRVHTKQDSVIEGVVFSDGLVVLHGGVFWASTAQDVNALTQLFPGVFGYMIEWLDV